MLFRSPRPASPPSSPGEQAAVVEQRVLQVDTPLLLGVDGLAVVAPVQAHLGLQVGAGTLQGQPVPPEHQLPLGWDQLEEGQLQGSVCREHMEARRSVEEGGLIHG